MKAESVFFADQIRRAFLHRVSADKISFSAECLFMALLDIFQECDFPENKMVSDGAILSVFPGNKSTLIRARNELTKFGYLVFVPGINLKKAPIYKLTLCNLLQDSGLPCQNDTVGENTDGTTVTANFTVSACQNDTVEKKLSTTPKVSNINAFTVSACQNDTVGKNLPCQNDTNDRLMERETISGSSIPEIECQKKLIELFSVEPKKAAAIVGELLSLSETLSIDADVLPEIIQHTKAAGSAPSNLLSYLTKCIKKVSEDGVKTREQYINSIMEDRHEPDVNQWSDEQMENNTAFLRSIRQDCETVAAAAVRPSVRPSNSVQKARNELEKFRRRIQSGEKLTEFEETMYHSFESMVGGEQDD